MAFLHGQISVHIAVISYFRASKALRGKCTHLSCISIFTVVTFTLVGRGVGKGGGGVGAVGQPPPPLFFFGGGGAAFIYIYTFPI